MKKYKLYTASMYLSEDEVGILKREAKETEEDTKEFGKFTFQNMLDTCLMDGVKMVLNMDAHKNETGE